MAQTPTPPQSPFQKVAGAPAPPAGTTRPRPLGTKSTRAVVELIPFPKLKETIESYYIAGSVTLMPFFPATSMVVAGEASKCADAWCDYAKASPAAHKMISRMLTGIGIGAVLAVHFPIVLAVMNEQKIPRDQRMMAMMVAQDKQQRTDTDAP